MFLKDVLQFVILYRDIFSRCPCIWGSISKTANIFRNIFGSTYWLQSIQKNFTRNFGLFVYFQSYNGKGEFSFLQTAQLRRNTSYIQTSHFCVKCWYRFLALVLLYTLKKMPWKNYLRFWKWNLKRTPQSGQNSFPRKSNLKFCIIFGMISFANAYGSVKIRLACSKVLLLINYFDRRSRNTFKNIFW